MPGPENVFPLAKIAGKAVELASKGAETAMEVASKTTGEVAKTAETPLAKIGEVTRNLTAQAGEVGRLTKIINLKGEMGMPIDAKIAQSLVENQAGLAKLGGSLFSMKMENAPGYSIGTFIHEWRAMNLEKNSLLEVLLKLLLEAFGKLSREELTVVFQTGRTSEGKGIMIGDMELPEEKAKGFAEMIEKGTDLESLDMENEIKEIAPEMGEIIDAEFKVLDEKSNVLGNIDQKQVAYNPTPSAMEEIGGGIGKVAEVGEKVMASLSKATQPPMDKAA